jgi:hypothetical protein
MSGVAAFASTATPFESFNWLAANDNDRRPATRVRNVSSASLSTVSGTALRSSDDRSSDGVFPILTLIIVSLRTTLMVDGREKDGW